MKPKTFTRNWNCYADTELITEQFGLQLWTLKEFTEPCISWK